MVIIGLGRFGIALGDELVRAGVEVLGIDVDEATVVKASSVLTHAVIAETTDADTLRQLGVDDAERVVIGIGSDLGASLLTASAVMDLGVKNVWAKADNDQHAKILTQIGVHHVVRPERDTGRRVAHLIAGHLQDYVEFDPDFAIAKLAPPVTMHGRMVSEVPPGITIVGVRPAEGRFTVPESGYVIRSGDLVIAAGTAKELDRFCLS
ncbi:TrkA family potassium uptake protein [Corynebacterium sp. H128]|uniref:potassium channel family protein n=1 Tax=unclassified Corynebacterium TaxID=2624378 RepID=UPI0030B57AA9